MANDLDKSDQLWGDVRKLGPNGQAGSAFSAEMVALQLDEPTPIAVMFSFDPGTQATCSAIVLTQRGQLNTVPIPFPGATIYAMALRVVCTFAGGQAGLVYCQAARLVRG